MTFPTPRTDPTGFPCPHDRVREYGTKMDRSTHPAVFRQEGVCYVCGYGVQRTKPGTVPIGDGENREGNYAPWSVFPGSQRDPLVVRRSASR